MFPKVFLGIPAYGEIEAGLLRVPTKSITASDGITLDIVLENSSALTLNFNRLWTAALNRREKERFTHFAMLHSDIVPDGPWISQLMAELNRTGADIVSAVSPIKDERGITTTGLWDRKENRIVKRFTVKECLKLPKTFTAAEAGYPNHDLLINTGCWLCKFDASWVEKFPGFHIKNRIEKLPSGEYNAFFFSEDWLFSVWAAQQGLKVAATTAVALAHHGRASFRNDHAWGGETDPGDGPIKIAQRVHAPEGAASGEKGFSPGTTKSREIVAVRYAEDMAWLHRWLDDLVVKHGPNLTYRIYDKAPGGNTPNIGFLDWTYLHHIVTRWDQLADWTVFTQADPFPHLNGAPFDGLLTPRDHPMFPFVVECREWDESGRLAWSKFPDYWRRQYENGSITPAKLSMRDWFKEYIGVDIDQLGKLTYHPGCIFGVSKECIQRRGKAFYERLLANLGEGGKRWPEECHYAERATALIYGAAS